MTKAKVTFVMESELKQQLAEACANIGLSMNRALNTLVRKTLCADPNLYELDYDEPNAETLAALKETQEILVLERVWGRASRSTGVSCGQKVDFNPFLEFFAATKPASLPKTLSRTEILADPSKAKFYDNVEDLMRDLRAEVAH